jgi:ribonuclease P protein component
MSTYRQGLSREHILRGYGIFSDVLNNSVTVSSEYTKAFVSNTGFKSNDTSIHRPLESYLKVGFIISKKRVRKAVERNYLRRLLKESFRLTRNFHLKDYPEKEVNLILTLTEKGFSMASAGRISFKQVYGDMDKLLKQVRNLLENRKER